MTQIAFIGLGNMGGPMAANLVKAGFAVRGFDLAESSKKAAAAAGIAVAASINDAVQGAETVITMLPAGQHVLDVWNEIVPLLEKGTLIIDCSTIDVGSAGEAHELAATAGLRSVDAPVSGGTNGAKNATLTFMAGGDPKAFAAAKPILERWVPKSSIAARQARGRRRRSATI
ncbi:3-hydroxyisobutyrate dehydrogenase [Afipia felis]|uniref:3-hydroxyisobutyrate dehydrogenase n=1 Tax=Afipia felis TaxID=1035 RepID=A0A090MLQ6_AFIFE|nr:3-hydroxyisobutyrate dehydrogenase [Afipia felis]